VVQSEAKGQLDKVLIRKHFSGISVERLVQTVIVVHVQEAAVVKIRPEPADLFVRQRDFPCPVIKRNGEEKISSPQCQQTDSAHPFGCLSFAAQPQQVHFRRGVVVTNPAPAYFTS